MEKPEMFEWAEDKSSSEITSGICACCANRAACTTECGDQVEALVEMVTDILDEVCD